jgi:hypothetical protein
MENFLKIADGIDVAPALAQLDARPDLWDQHTTRTRRANTPHAEASDIWVRFRPFDELHEPINYSEPHFPVWYPAWHALPALAPIVYGLCAHVKCVHLGGVLITKIPPGKRILPHADRGWHAEYHNAKVYVPLKSNADCVNVCEQERHVMNVGEAWFFNNLRMHSVENNGASERITLIVSMRVEP